MTSKLFIYRIISLCLIVCVSFIAGYADSYVVVIDAGHGGKDYGAIDNGVNEKDINLGVALKLGELIKKNLKDIKVVYTRDKDNYLTLQQRADKANKAKGDLFISIHTNSVDKSNPNRTTVDGASTYTLGLHKDKNNMDVARRENAVMTLESDYETKYSGFDPNSDESYIIFEMAQKANMAQSARFAGEVQKQMHTVAGRRDRGVHQAGFWVLWATSMPAVLVELDFICNPNSAKYIASEQGQDKLAKSLYNAVDTYFRTLSQHKSNRLQTQNNGMADESTNNNGVVLASLSKIEKTAAPTQAKSKSDTSCARRRRSDASKQLSEASNYEDEILVEGIWNFEPEKSDETVLAQNNQASSKNPKSKKTDSNTAQAAASKNTTKPGNSKNKSEQRNSTEVAQSQKSDKSKNNQSRDEIATTETTKNEPAQARNTSERFIAKAKSDLKSEATLKPSNKSGVSISRLSKKIDVYKIQIYSSSELLKASNEVFCGLSPVKCFKDGDLYKYTYGESRDKQEIYRMLEEVKEKIPGAFVVTKRAENL